MNCPELDYAVFCYVARLSHDEIGFDLHRLDRLVSTRFLLIALLGWLVTKSLDWLVWRDLLNWNERMGLAIFAFARLSWL